jgi:ABC-2 type transport system permease protein
MIAIFKRELANYFRTPLGYIFMGLFLLITGFFFAYGNLLSGNPYFTSFISNILFIFLLAVPLLTMRLLSEDRRLRTDQLLLTTPIKVTDIVMGKYMAAMTVYIITLLFTVLYAVVIGVFGEIIVSEVFGAYVGMILLGSCFISIGILISGSTDNQVTSAFFTFFGLLFIWLIELVKQVAPQELLAGILFASFAVLALAAYLFMNSRSLLLSGLVVILGAVAIVVGFLIDPGVFPPLISNVLDWFSLLERFNDFTLGILPLDAAVFYVSFTAVFLYLTIRLIEKRRWA